MWTRFIRRGAVAVSEEDNGIAGFAAYGRSPDPVGAGELFAMNVDPDRWGRGHGSALVAFVVDALSQASYNSAVLWTGVGNCRAQSLYLRLGWQRDGAAREADVLGVTVSEVRFRRAL